VSDKIPNIRSQPLSVEGAVGDERDDRSGTRHPEHFCVEREVEPVRSLSHGGSTTPSGNRFLPPPQPDKSRPNRLSRS
jgi:hypothetical protein